jgi:arginine/lysine/ornithine decarboxylase
MKSIRTPLWDAVKHHMSANYSPFHTPGHKGGKGVKPDLLETLGEEVFRADLSELPGLDDLHHPLGPIGEAQKRAAECFGAGETFFLVNGVSVGLQAALLGILKPGQKLLVPRNMHRSIWGAMVLAGCRPVYLQPEWSREWGFFLGIEPAALAKTLAEVPDLKALVVLHPSYEGLVSDLPELVRVAKKAGLTVIADEAHGGHFRFHPAMPISALEAGADIAVQGAHKTIGALTQAAMLHCRNGFSGEKIRAALGLLQSTSPSYLLMSSLDAARANWETDGNRQLNILLQQVIKIRRNLASLPGLECLGLEIIDMHGVAGMDLTKIVLSGRILGWSGFELAEKLRKEFAIQPEMAMPQYILLLLTIGDRQQAIDGLEAAITRIFQQNFFDRNKKRQAFTGQVPVWPRPEVQFTPREAFFAKKVRVSLASALGRPAGELVAPYPPGIPLLCSGELITGEVMDWLTLIRKERISCHGPLDQSLETIGVIEE